MGKWKCFNGYCIESRGLCNNYADCTDSSDESPEVCDGRCGEYYWGCKDGNKCVSKTLIMDGRRHCCDGSDEVQEYHVGRTCIDGYVRCDDMIHCINIAFWCDGRTQYGCKDGSDEEHCEEWTCPASWWKCANNVQCVRQNDVCDGTYDCNDRSDEDLALCDGFCPDGKVKCRDKSKCISEQRKVLDGRIDCGDGSDEDSQYHAGRECPERYVRCNDTAQCIRESNWCDGRDSSFNVAGRWYSFYGCTDGSDEGLACVHYDCPLNYWKCADKMQCKVYILV